jgi:sugar lactone lactonase YvrE
MRWAQLLWRGYRWPLGIAALVLFVALPISGEEQDQEPGWLPGHAVHIPSQYTNQESGYFSIVEGLNGRVYVGCAKYGVNAYLVEFNPLTAMIQLVVDVHAVLRTMVLGFAAQAKIHTRNNVGDSGKIYFGSKQGYPEKGEKRTDYLGGYVFAYDPKTGKTENFGMPFKHHGVISVTPDEARGKIYVSTCDDARPIESSHFLVYDIKTKTYKDLGDCEHSYAFIVVDHLGRAYHPVRGGKMARYDPATDQLAKLDATVEGQAAPKEITKDGAILNWDWSPDRKTLYAVEMSTNELFSFDLTAKEVSVPGKRLGKILAKAKQTDCRAMCTGSSGKVWMAVTEHGQPGGAMLHLVSYTPGAKAPRDHDKVAIANPDYTPFTDAKGKPLPWHHTVRKEKDGTLTPWQPMGVCEARDGSGVYILTIAPFTLLKIDAVKLK